MLLFDVSVLLAVHRGSHPHHRTARDELDRAIARREMFTVPPWVWHSVLRLATDRRVFPDPSTLQEFFGFADAVSSQPFFVPCTTGPAHLQVLHDVCASAGAAGPLVSDAAIAAQARELGATVVTFDRDFGRFETVRSRILRAS